MANKNDKAVVPAYQTAVMQAKGYFNKIEGCRLDFEREAGFAVLAISASSQLQACDLHSIRRAVTNVAMVGISLNPALAQAFLVPRGKLCCLDISYRGLIKIATDSGSVKSVEAHIVHKNDHFELEYGTNAHCVHRPNPFTDRGEMIGAYCIAILPDGSQQVEAMSVAQINAVRTRSKSAGKGGPWDTDYDEMARKTVVKRAYKYWPKTDKLAEAMRVLNEHEGLAEEARAENAKKVSSANDALQEMGTVEEAEIVTEDETPPGSTFTEDEAMKWVEEAEDIDQLDDIRSRLSDSGLGLEVINRITKQIDTRGKEMKKTA